MKKKLGKLPTLNNTILSTPTNDPLSALVPSNGPSNNLPPTNGVPTIPQRI